jgi:uncharacterized membrane protein YhaH (DUF805 family)
MEQWYHCPECDQDLLYGAYSCPLCKCLLDWKEGKPLAHIEKVVINLPNNNIHKPHGTTEFIWTLFSPKGRFTRKEFAICYFTCLILPCLLILPGIISDRYTYYLLSSLIGLILSPFLIYLAIISWMKRLHDMTEPRLFVLFILVPIVNLVFLIRLLITPSKSPRY